MGIDHSAVDPDVQFMLEDDDEDFAGEAREFEVVATMADLKGTEDADDDFMAELMAEGSDDEEATGAPVSDRMSSWLQDQHGSVEPQHFSTSIKRTHAAIPEDEEVERSSYASFVEEADFDERKS